MPMSKDSQSSGILSKMVKFVRHPATSWGDLDTLSGGRDTNYSQQALKEMIERKRRNDFVRKREFDMLRKLRSKADKAEQGYGGRPSFFQSSFSSKPDDRVGTLKKIDEIEAQMSQQWWRSRSTAEFGGPTTLPPDAGFEARADTRQAYRTTVPLNGATTVAMTEPMAAGGATQPGTSRMPVPPTAGEQAAVARDGGPVLVPSADMVAGGDSGFSPSQFYALDVQELALDPEIEEASIRFASGDDAATEQGLKDTLASKTSDATPDEWMALFDFYRATGQMGVFEQRAMDFANTFSRSAPQWVCLPEEAARRLEKSAAPADASGRPTWQTDADLDAHAVMLLTRLLQRSPPPWVLDWTPLVSLQPLAIPRLTKLFAEWGDASDVELRFVGGDHLRALVQRMTPSGDATVDQSCWQLRLAVLRVMALADEFEVVALDFCVTYELSPPSWAPPLCQYKAVGAVAAGGGGADSGAHTQFPATEIADKHTQFAATEISTRYTQFPATEISSRHTQFPATEIPGADTAMSTLTGGDMLQTGTFQFRSPVQGELVGELLGDPTEALAALDKQVGPAPVFVVSCRYLIRVDFSAAGTILNWVSTYQAKGKEIHFVEVHRLIAAFFHVIGITQYAKVQTRDD